MYICKFVLVTLLNYFVLSWSGLNVLLYGLPKQSFYTFPLCPWIFFKLIESREVGRFVQGQVC